MRENYEYNNRWSDLEEMNKFLEIYNLPRLNNRLDRQIDRDKLNKATLR